jgi:PPOX class probable F420-dependent enzyme
MLTWLRGMTAQLGRPTVSGMDEDEMRRRVTGARVARLATVTSDGRPHIVPCCFALSGDVVYSAIDAKPKSTLAVRRLANLRAHPHAALLVDRYSDDWSRLWWVRVDGEGRVLDGGAERSAAIVLLTQKYPVYVAEPPPGAVVAIDIVSWRSWP